jgi:hypothetical protein
MSELKELGTCRVGLAGECPWLTGVEGAIGGVESEEGRETSELDPSSHQVIVLDVRSKMIQL